MKLENLRDIYHLRPRTNVISFVTRIRNNLAYAADIYFQNRGFLYIQTPEIISSDCEDWIHVPSYYSTSSKKKKNVI